MTDVPISVMPDALLAHAMDRIGWYSTILTRVRLEGPRGEEAEQAGTGTLVRTGRVYGILTAHHVAELFEDGWRLGVVLIPQVHTHSIMPELYEIIHIARGSIDCEGPDLSFLRIHDPHVGTIKAYKSFYDLDAFRGSFLSSPPPPTTGAWFLFGASQVLTTHEPREGGFRNVYGYRSFCGAIGVDELPARGDFDYLNGVIKYAPDTDPPSDFRGVSGGGLWHALLSDGVDGGIDDHEYFLAGLAFWQSDIISDTRTILCHGPQSIYKVALASIKSRCA